MGLTPAGHALRRILAIDPWSAQLLIIGRDNDAAAIGTLPACDLIRFAVFLASLFPSRRPSVVGIRRLAMLLVPEKDVAVSIALDAHVHGRESSGTQLRRAEGLAIVASDADRKSVV